MALVDRLARLEGFPSRTSDRARKAARSLESETREEEGKHFEGRQFSAEFEEQYSGSEEEDEEGDYQSFIDSGN